MATGTTSARVLGIVLLAAFSLDCRSTSSTPTAPAAASTPAAKATPEAAWTSSEATERVSQFSASLSAGTASFDDVLEFAIHVLAGLDAAERKLGVDGSVTRTIRTKERIYLGSLRVLPATAAGVRPILFCFDTADRPEITHFDPFSRARLKVTFGLGNSALEYCEARSKSGYRPSLPLLQSITEEKPLTLGGNLLVDRQGACTWQGIVLRFKKEARNEPPWQEQETATESRGKAELASARAMLLRHLVDSVEPL